MQSGSLHIHIDHSHPPARTRKVKSRVHERCGSANAPFVGVENHPAQFAGYIRAFCGNIPRLDH